MWRSCCSSMLRTLVTRAALERVAAASCSEPAAPAAARSCFHASRRRRRSFLRAAWREKHRGGFQAPPPSSRSQRVALKRPFHSDSVTHDYTVQRVPPDPPVLLIYKKRSSFTSSDSKRWEFIGYEVAHDFCGLF